MPYDSGWKKDFEDIRRELQNALGDLALRIEHVGSTSVPGLSAKPIIDIDVVIENNDVLGDVTEALGKTGYIHKGDLGIEGREAFRCEGKPHLREHHLYVCPQDSPELKRHLGFRDWLRSHPEDVREYSRIKEEAAALYPHDIDGYIQHKSHVIEEIYRRAGLTEGKEIMRESHQKIIDAVQKKAETVCPGCLDILGVYGSAATGDLHEGSDLDLLIVLNDEEKRPAMSEAFILEDEDVGYDIYCTSWDMLKDDAECGHANLGKLMDSEIVFIKNEAVGERLESLRKKAAGILASDARFEKAEEALQRSFMPYAMAMTAETIGRKRLFSGYMISMCLDAVMLYNGRYFRLGTKRVFEELQGLELPENFREHIMDIVSAKDPDALDRALTGLLRSVTGFFRREEKKEAPAAEKLTGTYEEMYSNWRGKMYEAAEREDRYSSFMNMGNFGFMLVEIAGECDIPDYDVMGSYDPDDLKANAEAFDGILDRYLLEYGKAGTEPRKYPDADAFADEYLNREG